MIRAALIIIVAAAALAPGAAAAASSDWFEVEGGRVRLVTSGTPDAAGKLRGALQIELEQGWKTYWRDPGETGIPPSLDIGRSLNVTSVEIGFPAPARFSDDYASWPGYGGSVALPLTFTAQAPDGAIIVTADVLLGICEQICVPLNTTLEVDPANGADDQKHGAIVDAAFASLPPPSRSGFEVVGTRLEEHKLTVRVRAPGDPTDLFIAAPAGWRLGHAKRVADVDGAAAFRFKVIERPAAGARFCYTLVAGDEAVDGSFELP